MRLLAIGLLLCILTGCASGHDLDTATDFRSKLIEAEQCTFETMITAYYADVVYQFHMDCSVDKNGKFSFTVISPESIRDITGQIFDGEAAFTFDDQIIAFPIMADGRLSPVSSPWFFYKSLYSGYLSGCQRNDHGYLLSIDDSFSEDPLHLQIQTDAQCIPVFAEIYYQQSRVVSLEIINFTLV